MQRPNFLLRIGFLVNFIFAISVISSGIVAFVTMDTLLEHWPSWLHQSTKEEMRTMLIIGITLFGFALPITSSFLSVKAFKEPKFKVPAAITSLIYSIIPGILIFLGDYEQDSQN